MIVPGWVRRKSTPESTGVRLTHFADHIRPHLSAGGERQSRRVRTDLDGCFGTEQTPLDLQQLPT
jgi:membrane dipeptidase